MKKLKLSFLFLFYFFLLPASAFSEVLNSIKLKGNFRIKESTILEKIGFTKKNYSEIDLNNIQKKIYDTGFFKSVKLTVKNNILIIDVKENPIVNFFLIEGEKKEKFLEVLYENIHLATNKIFSESLLISDIEKIKSIYRSDGYYNIEVDPKISLLKNNEVNLIINIKKNNQSKINRIYFIGEKVFSSRDLLSQISSSESGWYKLSSNSILNEERINYDKFLLRKFYLNEGYYDVQITSANISFNSDNTANITFSINSGLNYKIDNIKLIEKTKFLNNNDLINLNAIISKNFKDKNYSLDKITKTKDNIYEYLSSSNYENSEVIINETKSKEKQKINVNIELVNNNAEIVNNISVKGNSLTNEDVIRSNILFSEGDSFSKRKKEKSIDKLKDTGIFKNVSIQEVKNQNNTVDLNINVTEQPTGSIYGGISAGTMSSSINFGVTENNFLGKGKNLRSSVSLGTEKINYDITYADPDYNFTGNLLKVRGFVLNTDYKNSGYKSTNVGNEISTTYYPYEKLNITLGLGADYDDVSSATRERLNGNYVTYKLFYGLTADSRNRKLNTTEGSKTGFIQSLAVPGSDIQYLKNSIFNSSYYSLSKDYVLNFQAGASSINSINNKDIKLSDRLFVPARNLRGFESRSVGPLEKGDHIGGNYSFYTNLSSTFPNPLPDNYNAKTLIFLDAGNVWGVDYDSSLDSNKIRSSYGVGLDWFSPLGPISITYANALSKDTNDKEENFSFQIGSTF